MVSCDSCLDVRKLSFSTYDTTETNHEHYIYVRLPPYALALLVEQIVELVCYYSHEGEISPDFFAKQVLLHIAGRGYTHTNTRQADKFEEKFSNDLTGLGPFSEEPKEIGSPPYSATLGSHEDTPAMKIIHRYKQTSIDSAKEPLMDHRQVSM